MMTAALSRKIVFVASALLAAGAAAPSLAQAPTTQPTATAPADTVLPPGARPITARVIEVRGDVKAAPIDSTEYRPVAVGDEFPPDTQIITGLRSSALLRVGDDDTYTAIVIDPASKTLLSELYVTDDSKRVNVGVGYGQVRAGVVEGGLKSDFTVSSPVATLSKRGTWNFGLFLQRPDTFQIFLLDQGLVDAFNKTSGERRTVLPGELVDQTMRRWASLANRLTTVPVVDILGQSDIEVAYNILRQDGLRILDPEGGATPLINLSSRFAQTNFNQLAQNALQNFQPGPAPSFNRTRSEGFFGTGRGGQLVPIVILPDSDLAKRGLARPGTYSFPRPVLERWVADRR